MPRIAIVTAYSEACLPLLKQLVVSCYGSISNLPDYEFVIYAYQYNWIPSQNWSQGKMIEPLDARPFGKVVDLARELPLRRLDFVQKDAVQIDHSGSLLPDIKVYHDFALHHLADFDYALFVHNDIVINDRYSVFTEMISILREGVLAFIGEPHIDCREAISVRIYPHFIFVASNRFREYELSFINDYQIFDAGMRCRSVMMDGGAGLLASCYHNDSKPFGVQPYTHVSRTWFTHLRMYNDNGIDSFNAMNPDTPMFAQLLEQAERYVDERLYGKYRDQLIR